MLVTVLLQAAEVKFRPHVMVKTMPCSPQCEAKRTGENLGLLKETSEQAEGVASF